MNGHVNGNTDGDDHIGANGTNGSQPERNDPKSAWVMAVYEDDAGEEQLWKRSITNQGASEYRINNRVVTALQYNEGLEAENILIKARNFLVFQGDVEAIASQSPRDLTKLIEQISGSLEYKAEYERLKAQTEEANEHQSHNLNRRRGINSEIKVYQEQKREAENYAKKAEERDEAIVNHVLWKLYHFQRVINESEAGIRKHHEDLREHKRGIEKYERNLEDARKEQAKASRDVSKSEKQIKEKEKDIEDKENGLVPIDEKIDIASRSQERCLTRVEEIKSERDRQLATVDQLKSQQILVAKAQAKWEQDWKLSTQQQGRQLSEDDIQQYNKLREKVNTRTSADQNVVDNLTRVLKTHEESVQNTSSKFESAQWQAQKLGEEIEELLGRKDTMQDQIANTSKDVDAKKKEFHTMTSERLRTAQKHTELDEKLREVLNKLLEGR